MFGSTSGCVALLKKVARHIVTAHCSPHWQAPKTQPTILHKVMFTAMKSYPCHQSQGIASLPLQEVFAKRDYVKSKI